MTHFEYISVMMSIIMGLGIIRLLGSFENVFSKDHYWPHAIWVVSLFWLHVQNWWGFWELRNVSFNVMGYSVFIGYASLLYLSAVALTNRADNTTSWREHYFAQRRWIFGVMILTILVAIFSTRILLGASLLHPYRIVQFSLLILAVLALVSERENVHKCVSVVFFSIMAVGISAFRFLPDMFNGASGP